MNPYAKKIKYKSGIFFLLLFVSPACTGAAEDLQSIQTRDVEVQFTASLVPVADEVLYLYPEIRRNLESLFRWDLALKPSVVLIPTREQFLELSGDDLVVAFAVPERNLIVIDYSRTVEHPFSIEATLKHELCHLLLHRHIKREILPKWMDEGLCQWASDGIGEMLVAPKRSLLLMASLSRRFIPLGELHRIFPGDEKSRLLAYAESKSFVAYLLEQFGRDRLIDALNHMKEGSTADAAIQKAFSIPFEILEKEWHHSLKTTLTWFTFLSYHLYEILFALMAVVTVLAFIRMHLKKKNYVDDEDVEERG
ncbi:MAG: hypothetical protein ABII68_11615 [Pseudomonadota bacterium]